MDDKDNLSKKERAHLKRQAKLKARAQEAKKGWSKKIGWGFFILVLVIVVGWSLAGPSGELDTDNVVDEPLEIVGDDIIEQATNTADVLEESRASEPARGMVDHESE